MSSNSSKAPKKHKWALSFTAKNRDERDGAGPPGFNPNMSFREAEASQEKENANLLTKRGWDMALGPWKQIPMNLFIMYMAGNSISIFPIMMVGMLFLTPVKAIFSLNSTFKTIEGNQATLQKLVYLLGNCAVISLALYKCQSMGLLPTHASDWLDFVEQPRRIEFSGGGIV